MHDRSPARPEAGPVRGKMAHGHSRLILLIDDLKAHIQGLCETSEQELLIEELLNYARFFTDELREHIAEEEADVFAVVAGFADEATVAELDSLFDEHRRIERELAALWQTLDGLRASEETCKTLAGQVESLQSELLAHSVHERQFLGGVEQKLAAAGVQTAGE